MRAVRPSTLDQVLRPVHRWVWRNPLRRARKLLHFAETEADGGRDLSRAAELTRDGLLRQLYLRHAVDEQRHASLFQQRGLALLAQLERAERIRPPRFEADWLAPGERGLDDLRVEGTQEEGLLAFLHLSEKAAAGRFHVYEEVLAEDPATREMFREILKDEEFHMAYTYKQLTRLSPQRHGWRLWQARLGRLWNGYLRLAVAVASALGTVLLLLQYFLVLPPFAWLAKRAARRESEGWAPRRASSSLKSQY